MNEQANPPTPRYVTCRCQHCDGHIEFDANELTEENSIVPCPHCSLETKIAIPTTAPLIQEPDAPATPPAIPPRIVTYPLESDGAPRYVICYCENCAGEIRFDANSLIVIGNKIPCPHCGLQTGIFAPQEEPKIIPAVATSNSKTSGVFSHKRVRFTKGTRVALTPTQRASPVGKELLDLLRDVVHDGLISEGGVRRLNAWLDGKTESDIPAIKFLLQISDRILRTGKVTTAKAFEMHFAIERVLPKEIRGQVKETRQEAWLHSPLKPKATDAQLKYIRALGGTPPPGINISEASLLIEKLLEESTSPSEQSGIENQFEAIRALGETPPAELTHTDIGVQMNTSHFTIVELQQGTTEWREWRHNGIGASDASTIMGENRFKSAAQLLQEKRGPAQDYGQNAAMARGTELEPEARRLYVAKTGREVRPACLQSTRYDWLRASLYGLAFNHDAVVEIKCGQSAYRTASQTRSVPDYYYGQLQHILAVTGLDSLDFWCYWPGYPALLIPVPRNVAYIERLLNTELEFWNLVQRSAS